MLNSGLEALSSCTGNILPTQNTPSQAKDQKMQNARERPKLKPRGTRQEVGSTWSSLAWKRQTGERLQRRMGGGVRSGEERLVYFFILARKFLEDTCETLSERARQPHVASSKCNSVYRGRVGQRCPADTPFQPSHIPPREGGLRPEVSGHSGRPPTAQATHHLDGRMAEVGLRHRGVVTLHHVNPFPGQSLDDGLVSLQGGHLVPFEDEAAHAAVQFAGQQELDDRRLDVLLLVLVDVEGVPEVLGDVICSDRRPPRVGVTPKCSRTGPAAASRLLELLVGQWPEDAGLGTQAWGRPPAGRDLQGPRPSFTRSVGSQGRPGSATPQRSRLRTPEWPRERP